MNGDAVDFCFHLMCSGLPLSLLSVFVQVCVCAGYVPIQSPGVDVLCLPRFETWFLLNLELTSSARLVGQEALGTPMSLPSQHWGL